MNRPRTHHVSIAAIARGYANVFRVEVVGFDGQGTFWARSWEQAVLTSRHYARIFDAPRGVL